MTSSTSTKNNALPPSLVANLQNVLAGRNAGGGEDGEAPKPIPKDPATTNPSFSSSSSSSTAEPSSSPDDSKPIILVTNGDGIGSPGLAALLDALVRDSRFNVHVCAPESDKSISGHSMTTGETIVASSTDINGATAFEVSGTPADCVSLALSGALFSWAKPTLVLLLLRLSVELTGDQTVAITCAVAGAREASMWGVPSLCVSLKWKKDESQDSNFKDAADVCLPLICAAIRDIEKGVFPKCCLLNVDIPTSPATTKGFKVTRQSLWRSSPSWQAVSRNRHPSSASQHQGLGFQLAQLGRDACAAGAARRLNTQGKTVEIESVAAAGKYGTQDGIKKYFRLEFLEKEHVDSDEDLDFKALECGFVAVTPICLSLHVETEASLSVLE